MRSTAIWNMRNLIKLDRKRKRVFRGQSNKETFLEVTSVARVSAKWFAFCGLGYFIFCLTCNFSEMLSLFPFCLNGCYIYFLIPIPDETTRHDLTSWYYFLDVQQIKVTWQVFMLCASCSLWQVHMVLQNIEMVVGNGQLPRVSHHLLDTNMQRWVFIILFFWVFLFSSTFKWSPWGWFSS